jgi:ABC-type transport system substrate-binding protein
MNDEGRPEIRFRSNTDYLFGNDQQPREVAERLFASTEAALSGLRRGEVDVIARLLPADTVQALRDNSIQTRPYRVPSTHVLIPNYDERFPADRAFRVAMLYAIDRQTILNRELLGGGELDGCEIVSGPFPRGLSSDDPISYGYNRQIDPRGYDPRLARVRLEIARVQATTAAEKTGEEAPRIEKLILAHPDDEIPRIACQHIANNWRLMGLEVELLVLPPGRGIPDGKWHFTYADLRITEPLTDASRLLAADGFARCSSPYLNLALRQLEDSENWSQAGQRLRAVHQICFDDVSVLPLWQIADHFAYRSTIDGLGLQPVSLYQNVEQWRLVNE